MSKSKLFMRRVIAFAGALIITFNIAVAPQRAKAVAVSASVVAAVAAIMTACGVSYWASTQDNAIEYLGGQIDDYFASLEQAPVSYEDWLGIDSVSQLWDTTADGMLSFAGNVASPILDFVRWFNNRKGVVSNGPVVGLLAGPVPIYTYCNLGENAGGGRFEFSSDTFTATFTGIKSYTRAAFYFVSLYIPGVYGATVTIDSVDPGNTVRIGSYGYVTLGVSNSLSQSTGGTAIYLREGDRYHCDLGANNPCNYVVLSFNNPTKYTDAADTRYSWSVTCSIEIEGGYGSLNEPDRVKVTPSTDVYVPDDVRPDQAEPFVVATNAAVAQGMTVEQGAAALMDAITTADGLASEVGEDAEPEGGVLEGWGWLSQILQRIERAISGTEEQTAPAQYEAIDSYSLDLTSFFPFCIPWDLHRGLSLLVAEPVAPSINWTVPLPDGSTYTLALDLSDWDGVAQVARTMELLAFVVALAVATKKLIKW